MFERFLRLCNDFINGAFDFAREVADFMSYEIDLSIIAGGAFTGSISVFELMFGAGVGIYLTFMIGKAIVS